MFKLSVLKLTTFGTAKVAISAKYFITQQSACDYLSHANSVKLIINYLVGVWLVTFTQASPSTSILTFMELGYSHACTVILC